MNILVPIISLGKSGGIKVLSKLSNTWDMQQHHVTIVVTDHTYTPYYDITCRLVFLDDQGDEVQRNSSLKYSMFKQLQHLYKYIKKNDHLYDVIIANYNLTTYPIFFASKHRNIYYIQAYEPEFYVEYKNQFIKKYLSMFLAWFSYFLPFRRVVNSNMYLSYKNIRAKEVIFPGIDLNVFYARQRPYKAPDETFVIGCIGRHEEWKGSKDVALAMQLLKQRGYNNIELKVAFNPVDYDGQIVVKPDGEHNLADYYRSLDVLVTPGHIQLDAIHYPVIEAMATKTPLITTGYYPSSPNNCYLVPVRSPEHIADTVISIMNDYQQAINKAEIAYQHIHSFSWDHLSQQFIDIIQDVQVSRD